MILKPLKMSLVILVCFLLPFPVHFTIEHSFQLLKTIDGAITPCNFGSKGIDANRIFNESMPPQNFEHTYLFNDQKTTYSPPPPSQDPIVISNDTDFVQQGWPGSGTQNDPYRIENLIINGTDPTTYYFGIHIHNTTAFFVIRNCSIFNCRNGINLSYLFNGLVVNNTVFSNIHYGIRLTGVNHSSIAHNRFNKHNYSIKLGQSHHNQVVNNTCHNGGTDINLYQSSFNLIANNTSTNDNFSALYTMKFTGSNMNTITGNAIQQNSEYYIDSLQASVENNTVNGEDLHYMFGHHDTQISNEKGQFILLNCTNIRIENCEGFIQTIDGENLVFFSNTWLARSTDMRITRGHSFTIIGERCLGPRGGISLYGGVNHSIRENTFANKTWGISGMYLDNCSISNNNCYNCTDVGIKVTGSNNILISDNICTLCDIGIEIFGGEESVLLIGNQCNSNAYGIRIDGGPIYVVTSPDLGSQCVYSIQDCQCNDNWMGGIYLARVKDTEILNSECMGNGYFGISLYQSSNVTIASCNCSQNRDIGINVHGQNNTIVNNNISMNVYHGLQLQTDSQGTRIQLNLFDGNLIHAALYELDTLISFNFWSNYTGYDANFDGIGDQPHLIFTYENTTYFDPYPLMSPDNRETTMHNFLTFNTLNPLIFGTGILFAILALIITILFLTRRAYKR